MEKSRTCGNSESNVHRASHAKHVRSKKHIEIEKQNDMIIPTWLFLEPTGHKIKNIYRLEKLEQIARNVAKLDDKQLNKEIATKMINLYRFTDRALQVGFIVGLDSHLINHSISEKILNLISSNLELISDILTNPKKNGNYLC